MVLHLHLKSHIAKRLVQSSTGPKVCTGRLRHLHASGPRQKQNATGLPESNGDFREFQGAMSRRLAQLKEDVTTGSNGSYAAKAALQADSAPEYAFSEELKRQLEQRIADGTFRSDNAQAFATAGLSPSADRVSRAAGAATPWTGTESVEAASLRMLTDSHRPLKVPRRGPVTSVRIPTKIDTGRSRASSAAVGARIANARDRTSQYSLANDSDMSEDEKAEYRRQLKERFQPLSRTVPATLTGLASLANERIDDAISRGQFKNIPRGARLERDHVASSPFLDTTEYFLNKIIQKQEIVPPWIEKQQEVVATASKFRARLRADWTRHVARLIASQGGDLEAQVALAEAYAAAEARLVEAEVTVSTDSPRPDPKISEASPDPSRSLIQPSAPFRDPAWEAAELSYHTLAIERLNALTRTYNLMAPQLAKKPYFSLPRELRACFADVAPRVPGVIRERAWVPVSAGKTDSETRPDKAGGVFARFGGPSGKVYDEGRQKRYGFREMWRDLWTK